MTREIGGKEIAEVSAVQPKCLNVQPEDLRNTLSGKRVGEVTNRGKWLFMQARPGYMALINLGMGADLVFRAEGKPPPDKYQVKVDFTDGSGFSIRFWWFGHVHVVPEGSLDSHELTRDLGPSPLDPGFTVEAFRTMLQGSRGRVKPFIMDQRRIAGIGNAYVHDILFDAGIHPDRAIPSLSEDEISRLHASIRRVLGTSVELGGAYYEKDFYGNPGGCGPERWVIGYREGKPCPRCGTVITKIKTGGASTFICPECQKI
jgi:formamidopyrimidine-DNA glycosylase